MFNYYVAINPFQPYPHPQSPQDYPKLLTTQEPVNVHENMEKLRKKIQKLQIQYERYEEENKKLKTYANELQVLFQPQIRRKKEKIVRRSDNELSKQHYCPYAGCKKSYAAELSLSFHMRIKHNAGTKTERIAYLNEIAQAKQRGLEIPPTTLNLPPQVIEYQSRLLNQKSEGESSERVLARNMKKGKKSPEHSISSEWKEEERSF